jgi:hypothetical protein
MKKTKTTSKKTIRSAKKTKLTKGMLAYHIAASLVSTSPHPHTGRSLHPRHTSHGALLLALLFTGVILFTNLGTLRAYGITGSGTTTISVTVSGQAPSIGADITYPTTDTMTNSPEIQVTGTCPSTLLVAIYNNGIFAGSSTCDNSGSYAITVQLQVGTNQLQAQDYDGLNQPGPATAQVEITREAVPVPVVTQVATAPTDIAPAAVAPIVTPAPQPDVNPCFDTSKTDALNPTTPTIIANCIQRSVYTGDTVTVPIRVTGGTKPYALLITWGDGTTQLETVLDTNYHNYTHIYKTAGIIGVSLKTTDANGITSYLQTVVQVSGTSTAPVNSTSSFVSGLSSIWTEAPVPLYWAAVTLVLGFWVGDIFQRIFVKDVTKPRKITPTVHRRRHA